MKNKMKIEMFTPYYSYETICYSGMVNGVYEKILSYDKLTKKEQREKLIKKYENEHIFICEK